MRFEDREQEALQKLVTSINTIRILTANAKNKHAIAVCNKAGNVKTLHVFEPLNEPDAPLPDKIKSQFWTSPLKG